MGPPEDLTISSSPRLENNNKNQVKLLIVFFSPTYFFLHVAIVPFKDSVVTHGLWPWEGLCLSGCHPCSVCSKTHKSAGWRPETGEEWGHPGAWGVPALRLSGYSGHRSTDYRGFSGFVHSPPPHFITSDTPGGYLCIERALLLLCKKNRLFIPYPPAVGGAVLSPGDAGCGDSPRVWEGPRACRLELPAPTVHPDARPSVSEARVCPTAVRCQKSPQPVPCSSPVAVGGTGTRGSPSAHLLSPQMRTDSTT